MKVVQIMRKPNGVAFSIEQLFEDVRKELPENIAIETYTNPYRSCGVWRRLAAMVRAVWHQGDINHITGDVHFLSIFLRRRKTILTVHDCVTLERLTGIKYQVFRFFWYWLPAKRSAAITVISESTKKELLRHLGRGDWRITIVPDPVSCEFKFSEKVFNHSCPVILQVGTKSNKNLERVAAALKGVSCKLVIIGKLAPSQVVALKENEIDFDNQFSISREALIEHYRTCDIVMFASLYEGFGLPILEAQAIGRPVITSNLYSMPEVGGENGACYVDPYQIDDIRRAVDKLTIDTDCRERLVTTGLSNVEKYQAASIASQYADLYRNIYSELSS